jgi:hypothetical protein
MSNITSTFRGSATLSPPTTPTIYNVAVTLANTEYSQALSAGTKKFMIKCRSGAKLQLSYNSGDTNILYITIPKNTAYTESDINFSGTLYFRSDTASQVVEIVEWT